MSYFKDSQDREWEIAINVSVLKRVRSTLDINLMGMLGTNLIQELVLDPCKLCDVIYVICKPQADEKKISDEDFGEAMGGDSIADATDAFIKEMINFFPKAKRSLLQNAVDKMNQVDEMAIKTATEMMDGIDLDEQVKKIMNEGLKDIGKPSGSLPGLLESNPDLTHSGS